MRLPDGNGLTLLKRLLQNRPELRLVIHTDFDSFASVVLALCHGAVDYLVKSLRSASWSTPCTAASCRETSCPTLLSA